MNKQFYDVVMCGAGPANISLIPDLLKDEAIKNCLILEKTEMVGSGSLKKYKITANSLGSVFLEKFDGCDDELSQYIRSTSEWEHFSANKDKPVELRFVGQYLERIARFIQENKYGDRFNILTEAEVKKIKQNEEGNYDITYHKNNEDYIVSARKVLFNIGGNPNESRLLHNSNNITSGDFIKGFYDEVINKGDVKSISILGSSHSSVSCLIRLIEQLEFAGKINVFVNKDFKLFFDSPSSAESYDYDFTQEDICPLSNRVNRYSGLRYDSFAFAQELKERKYKNISILNISEISDDEIIKLINCDDLLIHCTGYHSKLVEIIDKNNIPLEFKSDRYGLLTNEKLSPISTSGEVLNNFHTFGLGSGVKTGGENGGEASFHGRIDGVWVYQHVIYDIVFN
ncbi:SidA/IucD/PvdA family monooxygenase [Photorhabdus sp. RW14-46]|uniref:SidA/IucD/PvdA family monooxygenase n=1 Tax=Photorhabdus sp. RW14-46 TaxID=2100168 RepID=UPI0013F4ADCD|nr:SidA/IucD/PvdA family monooxygenase [Photorhabdus sp. RW14-46]NHB61046.1 hypothetical protein [Photorhabdus sp. RW14-46]